MSIVEKALKSETLDDALFDQGCEEIITERNGDARAAIRALLQQVSYLELARNRAESLVSYGFGRGNLQ